MPFHLSNDQLQYFIDHGTKNERYMSQWVINYKQNRDEEAKRKAMVFFRFLPKAKRDMIEQMEKK
jgi:hypothetical protein